MCNKHTKTEKAGSPRQFVQIVVPIDLKKPIFSPLLNDPIRKCHELMGYMFWAIFLVLSHSNTPTERGNKLQSFYTC